MRLQLNDVKKNSFRMKYSESVFQVFFSDYTRKYI